MECPPQPNSMPKDLKEATKDVHIQAENAEFMRNFQNCQVTREGFKLVMASLCHIYKALEEEEMEEFVQSSGEHGIVVFSLGSMVKNLTEEKACLIASALAQIPQKVLWRYKGKIPATLGSNTRLFDWIPQNDLLGHPKTRAFITHGGTNGIYEAIYHGIPMVGLPMFADQPDNIAHMKAKGAAVEVNMNTMESVDLLNALRTVINDPSLDEHIMASEKWVMAVFAVQLCCVGYGLCGKVLVWPCDMSHWLNMKTILEELVVRGHEVTVLKYSTIMMDQNKHSALHFENIPLSHGEEIAENHLSELVDLAVNVIPNLPIWQGTKKLQEFFFQLTSVFEDLCRNVLYNQTFMRKLRDTKYDVMVIDPVIPCGELVAEVLQVPFVNTLRFSMGYTIEKYCGQLPLPLSYVPVIMGELTDNMTFTERVKNMMLSLFFEFGIQQYDFAFWDKFYSETLGRPTTFCETIGKAEIWLIRTYWDFEYPRPHLPNFEFVGGLHCKPSKPLPKEMEEFVESSGEHGIVVFSLGSMVKNLTEDKANLIASALAQIPQKVGTSSGSWGAEQIRSNWRAQMTEFFEDKS
ncbi:hypothetical protein NN561_005616 [Cricetulus griseus]